MTDSIAIFEDTAPYVRRLVELPRTPLLTRSSDALCLLGSCFAWHLHNEALRGLGLNSFFEWRTGFHFSTESLANLLEGVAGGAPHTEDDLYFYPDALGGFRPFRYYFDQRFPVERKDEVLGQLAVLDAQCAGAIRNCTHLLLVTGTPRVVRLKATGQCVAVTAKMPRCDYEHHRNTVEHEVAQLERVTEYVLRIRDGKPLTMLFMLSPMRYMFHPLCAEEHETDKGSPYVEDNLGKAIMRVALHTFLEKNAGKDRRYFPAYEIVIDELRSHEPFCGDHAHVPHFPHVSHYVVRRFLDAYVARDLLSQIESSETLAKWTETMEALLLPAQKEAMLADFVRDMLPRIRAFATRDKLNAALLRNVFLFLAACAGQSPGPGAEAFAAVCRAMDSPPAIAVWGVGGRYQAVFSAGVARLGQGAARLALTDGSPGAWGREVDGLTVVSPQALAAMDVDYIFIASYEHDAIHARIRQLGLAARVA